MNAQATPLDLTLSLAPTQSRSTMKVMAVVLGSLLIFASSRLQVPGPVPFTMQSLAVIFLGMALGSRLATLATMAYFLECWAFPGFSASAMPLTGGYVLGFIPAAWIAGRAFELGWGKRITTAFTAMVAANLVIFVFGVPWLAMSLGLEQAFSIGFVPFILADLIKIALCLLGMRGMNSLARRFERALESCPS